jgi:hypothetical protein
MVKKRVLLLTLLLVSSAYAVEAKTEIKCYNTGAIFISGATDRENVYAKIDYKKIDVPGRWSRAGDLWYFHSEEAIFTALNKTSYTVYVGKRSYRVTCPAFVFSCKVMNISIATCYMRDDLFVGKYYAYNFKTSKKENLRFTQPFLLNYHVFTAEKKKLTHGPQILSPEFKNITLSVVHFLDAEKYILRWKSPYNITRFAVHYDKCVSPQYNFYKSIVCSEKAYCWADWQCLQNETCEEEACEELKCGACQYIQDHKCVSYECCENDDCNDEEQCISNFCLSLSCKENEQAINHSCVECKEDEGIVNGSCEKLACGEGEGIINHKCVKLGCEEDEQIQNNKCIKLSCGFLQKPADHKCTNVFILFLKRIF